MRWIDKVVTTKTNNQVELPLQAEFILDQVKLPREVLEWNIERLRGYYSSSLTILGHWRMEAWTYLCIVDQINPSLGKLCFVI